MANAAGKVTVVVQSNRLPGADVRTRKMLGDALGRTAFAIEAGARQNTKRVDTGNMKGAWQAEQLRQLSWVVFTPVEYAIYWEFGHNNRWLRRYMPPEPMLRPAAVAGFAELMGVLQRDLPEVLR